MIEAWFAYNAATREEMLPRIPTPAPDPNAKSHEQSATLIQNEGRVLWRSHPLSLRQLSGLQGRNPAAGKSVTRNAS
jgi:hypothetical protein